MATSHGIADEMPQIVSPTPAIVPKNACILYDALQVKFVEMK